MRRPKWLHLPRIKNKRRAVSWTQNVIILVLVASALLLAGSRAGLGLGSGMSGYGMLSLGEGEAMRDYSAAAEPLCVVVTPESGVHCAAMYDARALEEYYSRYSAALAEALGSAGEPELITADDWEEAISGRGIYLDYYADFQLSSLAIWLGTEMNSGAAVHTARRICLSLADGEVQLYYLHGRTGDAYRCTTELSYTVISDRVSESTPNGAQFVFEMDEDFSLVDPYMVVTSGTIEVTSVSGGTTLNQSNADGLMEAFGINPNLARGYTETDGTDVYLEGSVMLRLGGNGLLRYTNRTDLGEPSGDLSPTDAIELTRGILEDTVGLSSGVATLRLTYIMFDTQTREWTLRYDYTIDGLPVSIAGRTSAAEFHLTGAVVTSADIFFASYSYTGSSEHPLPAVLEAALVQTEGGGEPRLVYVDVNGSVAATWIVV